MALVKEGYLHERIAAGQIAGVTPFYLNGINTPTTTTFETLWPASTLHAFATGAISTPYASSSSTNDAAAGTGARTIRVTGVNTSYATFSEDVTLNGQTSVNLATANVLAINSITVLTAGSGGVNAGTVYVGNSTNSSGVPANAYNSIGVGHNKSLSAVYCVPADYTLLIHDFYLQAHHSTAGIFDAKILSSENLGLVMTDTYVGHGYATHYAQRLKTPIKYNQKTQIQVQANATAGTPAISCVLSGWLIDNTKEFLGI